MKKRLKFSLILTLLTAISTFLSMSIIGLASHGNGGGP